MVSTFASPGARFREQKAVGRFSPAVVVCLVALFSWCIPAHGVEETNWYQKGDALLKANQYPEAIAALTTAIETVPHDYQAYCKRAAARYLSGDCGNAIADYDAGLALNPNDAVALHQLALVLAYCPDPKFRNLSRALTAAKGAVALVRRPGFLATLAKIQDDAGARKEAVRTQEALIALARDQGNTKDMPAMEAALAKYRRKIVGAAPAPPKTAPPLSPRGPVRLKPPRTTDASEPASHPFTIHVYSFRDKEKALGISLAMRANRLAAFVTPIALAGKGQWYRVYVGAFGSESAARKRAFSLKRRKLPYARVVRRPWTVQIIPPGESTLADLGKMLDRSGIPTYGELAHGKEKRRLYGAFKTEKEARQAAGDLTDQGFNAAAVAR